MEFLEERTGDLEGRPVSSESPSPLAGEGQGSRHPTSSDGNGYKPLLRTSKIWSPEVIERPHIR